MSEPDYKEAVRLLEFANAMRCPVCHGSVDLGHYLDCPVYVALNPTVQHTTDSAVEPTPTEEAA